MSGEIALINNNGKKVSLNRTYKAVPDYTTPSNIRIGVNQTTPGVTSTALVLPIPILNGTVCDNGDNTFTGSSGGDNTTDNVTTYKQGAGVSDAKSQNLIANGTSVSKIWTNASLSANCDATKYVGCWFYVKDATTLAKFLSAGTCLELRIGADSTANYYSKTYTASQLSIGWNWLSDGLILSTWTAVGTPGVLNDFQIRITTNLAASTFVAGDVLFDLLRQWVIADTVESYSVAPVIDEGTLQVTMEYTINTGEASGFLLNGLCVQNTDATPLVTNIIKHTDSSKGDTDIFLFTIIDRYI